MRSTMIGVLAAATLAAMVAGCGSTSSPVVRPPASSQSTAQTASSSATPATTSSTSTAPHSSSGAARHPVATVSPSSGLRDGQTVKVTGTGFSPGMSLIVVQCADKGTKTGSGDCNLAASANTQTDAAGRTTVQLTVARGPFGMNNIVCNAAQRCLISVTQASLTPTEEADAAITFS